MCSIEREIGMNYRQTKSIFASHYFIICAKRLDGRSSSEKRRVRAEISGSSKKRKLAIAHRSRGSSCLSNLQPEAVSAKVTGAQKRERSV